ncbi:hypothetical protein FJZ36_00250 [Candidatus Poribacteria bacterium]|nr:hypothetical protein [Candidatus Poribacteria bacterium]
MRRWQTRRTLVLGRIDTAYDMAIVATYVWTDGRLAKAEDGGVSPSTRLVLYGHGAFETMRWRAGRGVVHPDRHLARLRGALRHLRIRDPFGTEVQWEGLVEQATAEAAHSSDVVVRVTVGCGEEIDEAITIVHVRDVAGAWSVNGIRTMSLPEPRYTAMARYKTTGCADNILARESAQAKGYDEAIWADPAGTVLEGCASNVFAVMRGVLVTPPADLPLLSGVTRSTVVGIAKSKRIGVEERAFDFAALLAADEVFVTNAASGVVPVVEHDGMPVGTGQAGSITLDLRHGYDAL